MKVFFAFFTFLILSQGITAQEARQIQLTNNTLTGQNYIGNASVNVTNNYVEPTKNAEFFAKEYARLAAIKREAEAATEESRLMEAEAKALMREAKGRELKAKLAEEKSRAAESQRASTLEKVRKERQNLESNRQKLQQESQRIIAEFNRAVAKNEQREKDSLNETNDATQSVNNDELQSITSTIEQQMEQVRENFQETVATIEKLSTDFEVYEIEDEAGKKSYAFSLQEIQNDPNYVFVGELIDGVRVAKKFNKFGLLNERGETIIDYQYDYFEPFREGVAVVSKFGEWKLIDKKNNTVREFGGANQVRTLVSGHRIVSKSNSASLQNFAGEVVLDLLGYQSLRPFGTTGLWVVKKGGYGIIDLQGKIILETKYSEIGKLREDGYADLKQSSKYGLIDNQGGVVIAPVSGARVSPPVNGLAKIKEYDGDYSKIGLYSVEKGVLLEPQYNEINLVDEDRKFAIVGERGKYGVFDTRTGVFKYPVAFKNIEETTQGNYWLEKLNEYQLVNQAFSPIFKKTI